MIVYEPKEKAKWLVTASRTY